jgi:hypothetical protein
MAPSQVAGAWSDEADFERRMQALREGAGVEHLLVFSPLRAALRLMRPAQSGLM